MKKTIIIFIIIAVLGCGVAILLRGDAKPSSDSISKKSKEVSAIGAETFATLNKLESLTLDDTIFLNPVYKRLKSFSKEISRKSVGKTNPFDNGDGGYYSKNVSTENSALLVSSTTTPKTKTATSSSPIQ